MQFGSVSGTSTVTVNLPTSYSNANYKVLLTGVYSSLISDVRTVRSGRTISQFQYNTGSTSVTQLWITVGY